jgi:hypothetical protein
MAEEAAKRLDFSSSSTFDKKLIKFSHQYGWKTLLEKFAIF